MTKLLFLSRSRLLSDRRRMRWACPWLAACALASCLAATPVRAVPAGSDITNTAHVDLLIDGLPARLPSNTVHIQLGELLDVTVVPVAASPEPVQAGETGHVSAFVLTNAGNGQETFVITAAVEGIDATITALWSDANGNGRLDEDADTRLAPGGTSAPLAPGSSRILFVVSAVGSVADGSSGSIALTATAATGSGPPGNAFPQSGDAGSDAVVGATTASATAHVTLIAAAAGATLVKSQTVTTAGGGETQSGSVITYTLSARFTGSAAIAAARIADPIPAGTDYVPGSLRLDGAALSDAADGDGGAFDSPSRTVSVLLGDSAGAVVRTVTFQVRIH